MKNLLFILFSAVAGVAVTYFLFKKKEEKCDCDKEKETASDMANGRTWEMTRTQAMEANKINFADLIAGIGGTEGTGTPISTEEAQAVISSNQLATWD